MHIEQLALVAALSLLVGVGLGQLFRVGAALLVSAVTIVVGIAAAFVGGSVVWAAVATVAAVVFLQFGYMVGLVLRPSARHTPSETQHQNQKSEAIWH